MTNLKARKVEMIRVAQRGVHDLFGRLHYGVANFKYPSRAGVMQHIRQIKRERKMLLTPVEAYQLYAAATAVRRVPGDAAEVGVFRGASAKLIRLALPDKQLHLFDTFEGLPQPEAIDGDLYSGQYSCGLDEVKRYLGSELNTQFHVGLFPDSAAPAKDRKFAFVHLDMDLFDGTLAALNWFYPRLHPGGIIITHDYVVLPGPTRAFNEFFSDKPEPIIELSGCQCMAIKLSCQGAAVDV
jgi:predicted O-methyltransferase YrrM